MTRLRAITQLGPGPHVHDAQVALAVTRRHLCDAIPYAIEDLSLCHGLGGAAEVLLYAGDDAALDLGHVALERYALTDAAWPCGAPGVTPALFRGLSGIAWLFLRLHDRTIQSPLAIPMHG
jgi:hypothetical protein